MLEASHLRKTFPSRNGELVILDDVSLTVEPGESIAVMGPSGSGKSTLLNILGTLEKPTSGSVRLDGADPFALDEKALARFRGVQVGFVFQDHHLLPQCSAIENVLLPTLVQTSTVDVEARARALLERVGLKERIEHRPAELSGGQQQRAAIARALVNRPKLLLADEPTGNLDRTNAERVGELLASLVESEHITLVVVTHSEALAARFGRRFELNEGRLSAT
jgi:lipoprotein-releasing system ATP-binding protein